MTDLNELQEKINYPKTFDCVQCGYCLPACPTYETMQTETHSPRGRINLVKMLGEGKIGVEDIQEPIEKCLGCRACETACPSNVEYGQILEGAKQVIEEQKKQGKVKQQVEKALFNHMFPSRKWMDAAGHLTWLYQKSGLQTLAQLTDLTKIAPLQLGTFEKVLPKAASPTERKATPSFLPAKGKRLARVGFMSGCIMDSLFHSTNQRTIELLSIAGAEVVLPKNQTCCGALHAHSGKREAARQLAQRNIQAFEEAEVDYVVNNAGGCGAMLAEYDHLFEGEPSWDARAKVFVEKSIDVSALLHQLNYLEFTREIDEVVTYQPSCHMLHVQKVLQEPVELLSKIPGLEYREMNKKDRCCGSAGIYNVVHYEDSMSILNNKMANMKQTQAAAVITTNPGCLLQMKLGIQRAGLQDKVRVVHLVDLLMEAAPQPGKTPLN
ncbi:(Fe-S)-binding protein [Salsuginibacillus kocurii]|uniref:(Fe-S)-binding protein n=1 Tax=Salsuginibacillus kocurii TaxID=427078 RepID=UPI00036D6881|nr:(Fe-S)-binding protein [Salsuginibacillus kocurii]